MENGAFTDSGNMRSLIEQFPAHFRDGLRIGAGFRSSVDSSQIRNVIIAGMGGSAIGGDLLRVLGTPECPVPIQVVRGYELPHYASEHSLVIISSYSGNTEETLVCFDAARERGSHIICIASGGEVIRRAAEARLPHVTIPGGMPPRAALGYSFAVLLRIAHATGLISLGAEDFEEAVTLLDQRGRWYASDGGGRALEIARALKGRLPVIYSGSGLLEAVNLRWRGQIQENAKTLAYGNLHPELNHNEVMGWEGTPWLAGQIVVVTMRDRDDHPRVKIRMDILKELISRSAAGWIEVETSGNGRLARMLSLIQLGDWVSFQLARLNGVDPTPIHLIDQFKARLSA